MTESKANLSASLAAGLAGAVALTLVHESMRRVTPNAPRMDVLGERAIAKSMRAFGVRPPREPRLHQLALVGDIATNTLFYALVGRGPGAWLRGAFLGTLAGVGAVLLPPVLGLGRWPRGTNRATKFMTCGYYVTGAITAAAASRGISAARAR